MMFLNNLILLVTRSLRYGINSCLPFLSCILFIGKFFKLLSFEVNRFKLFQGQEDDKDV